MERDKDPLCPDVKVVVSFLVDLHSQGKAYSTINVHRSMLSSTLGPCEGFELGSHPLITRLMKGCFNRRPPEPRYSSTWNPDQVLNFATSSGSNYELDLVDLSAKLCTLLAMATLLRVSEIASIGFDNISFSDSGVSFSLTKPRKSQRSGALQTHPSSSRMTNSGALCFV